ncbi:hypothetical protein ACP70R_017199 [Stipagrostis hirtigluma subsp. patula]
MKAPPTPHRRTDDATRPPRGPNSKPNTDPHRTYPPLLLLAASAAAPDACGRLLLVPRSEGFGFARAGGHWSAHGDAAQRAPAQCVRRGDAAARPGALGGRGAPDGGADSAHPAAVYNYVQRLIMNCLSCQVFTFGSVPLKTYLPDGDIDVTAFGNSEELNDNWARLVRDALLHEEKSENAEFRVKEVQYIQAEVKIIKCLVENIAVDITFNQVGGLCTLCFLEEIDNLINKNHLFKRSIILIKAWCFFESRILGAHHGLISTYALETLVLYIFHIFNNSFTGPLEVLYRFLEFFSNFDWEKFCLSLWGPVPISSLPDMTAEPPWVDSGELLLSKSFLENCSTVYAVMPRPQGVQGQPFVSKHFNVIDPLRTNNNLGRSVSKVNFFRIRSAFAFGAKRLAKLLECPKEDLVAELNQFFTNTWKRHGSGIRPDVPTPSVVDELPLKVVPVVVSNSHRSGTASKKKVESSGLTFVPTGPPVPFVVLPFVPGNSDGSIPQFERSEGIDQLPANIAVQNYSSRNDVHHSDTNATSTSSCSSVADPSDEHKPDILNSDFASHWHNLQYGRICQNAHPLGPVVYPFAVPPVYLQGHAPWDGPGRPASPNVNWTQMVGPGQRVFPVMPVQSAPERVTGALQHYGEDAPKFRGGTGTYFPNPKVQFRERYSNSRNNRGYSSDRSDHSDREGSWMNSKQRNPNRSDGRSPSDRSGMRSDRHSTEESSHSDRQRRTYNNDPYRHEAGAQYHVQGQSFGYTNSMRKLGNIAHGVYISPPTASNVARDSSGAFGPPLFMMYPYEPDVNHGATSSEPVEFGSLGPLPTGDGGEISRPAHQVMPNGFYGQYHSSPDQPSSPRPRR